MNSTLALGPAAVPHTRPGQAVLSLFNDRISSAVHSGIAGALSDDVPSAVNGVLASLPTHVVVQVRGRGGGAVNGVLASLPTHVVVQVGLMLGGVDGVQGGREGAGGEKCSFLCMCLCVGGRKGAHDGSPSLLST